MSIATQVDVEQRLQVDFANAAEPVVDTLLAAAQGHIEREVGYPLETATGLVERFDFDRGRISLFLSRQPVTAITSIVEDGVALAATDYLLYSTGRVVRLSGGYRSSWLGSKPQAIVVTYTAGYTIGVGGTIPKDLVDICANVASRAFERGVFALTVPSGLEGVRSIALEGSDSVTYTDQSTGGLATMSASRPVQLTPEEITICRAYRLPMIL